MNPGTQQQEVQGTPPGALPPLVQRWVTLLEGNDLDGLLSLYHPDAEMDAFSERPRGTREIRELVKPYWRRLRMLRIRAVELVGHDGHRLSFETRVGSLFGEARLRHDWAIHDGRIRHHGVQLLERAAPALD